VVVGAFALAAHGRPRYTDDLDVFVDSTKANARRIVAALRDFGFAAVRLSERDFSRPGHVVQLGRPPVRIDILTSISGVSFRQAWKGRLTGELEAMQIAFLGLEQYVTNKRASGRPKDLLDLALLDEAGITKPKKGRKR
jgi:hypothetical protein